MCGIAGIVGSGPPDPEVLERMARCMLHRGPDGERTWSDAHAGLAFRRLAVVDLDERSMQPMRLGAWHLVLNGEIYNYPELRNELMGLGHSFRTEGDAEVLLHAWAEWEEETLRRLDGMFAFAIWNGERRELVCASDPFGEKPLYWAEDRERLVFASDIRAVLQARPDLGAPRLEALAPYLGRGQMPRIDQSFFAGIQRLPGAHVLRLKDGRTRVYRYWRPSRVETPSRYEDAVERLRDLLLVSIRRRLRSDVPVGTSLSGGIDSSAVVALSSTLAGGHRRHAFTARFPGFVRDEWRYARDVATSAEVLEHHAVEPTPAGLLGDLEEIVSGQEEPFGSSSIYAQWCVMRAAREAGVTVLLDGQGADEIFGGYPGSNGWALRSMGRFDVLRGLASGRDRAALVRATASEYAPGRIVRAYRRAQVTPYAAADVAEDAARVTPPSMEDADCWRPLARELLRQAFHTSLPELLRYADRSSMAHGREVRLPFLSTEVAEFGFSLPAAFVYRNGVTKAVLRDAVAGLAPGTVLGRRDKVGFETPQAEWLSLPEWVARISEVLLDPSARVRELIDARVVERDVRARRWRDPAGIWRAVNLELWQRRFERPARPAHAHAETVVG
jgi:asparagine synthase (glutamine-hydrolysing)